MSLVVSDRIQQTGTANTTVSFTLSATTTAYQSFAVVGNGNTTYYAATDGTNWEVGLGTYSTTGPTLTRTTILSSSNSNTAVTFSGTVTVWCDYPASKAVIQDSSNNVTGYTISGGTIDNTVIGGTTPAAGTFTTITGQTEVLKGTGQNLLLQSSNLTAANWNATNNITVTGSQTDPLGGSTASLLTDNSTNGSHFIYQGVTTNTETITFSLYAKAGTANGGTANNFIVLAYSSTVGAAFNLTTGATVSIGLTAPISTSATNTGLPAGWWRFSITVSNASAFFDILMTNGTALSYVGTGSTVYVAAPQLEIGSVANTYIPTTTTAVYGTPTLSFSGVAGLGLQSDGSLYVSPAGTGALQAQATTSSTVGGNARGANAVDWQTSRNSAGQVASGQYASLGGGYNNTSSGYASIISGGRINISNSDYSVVAGGYTNTASAFYAAVVGGYTNNATGIFNFIGGGSNNTGTANGAVTTQSATMNGTTAVTLAATNANIKAGQYITGTSIASYTYVAAISGTSLTLSQAASGSSTSTLSFYTPHGVVVGGGNNQATGSYSFIGGGGDAGTAANRNSVVSDWGVVVGGFKNTVSATGTHNSIVGGYGNTISGGQYGSFIGGGGTYNGGSNPNTITNSAAVITGGISNNNSSFVGFIGGGYSNTANGANYSTIVGGQSNTVNSSYGFIAGGIGGTTRGITGYHVFVPHNSPVAVSQGVQQIAFLVLGRQTTDATATVLCSDSSAAGTTNQVILPNNSAYYFKVSVIAGVTGAGNTKAWKLEGAIKRGAGVGTTAIVGSVVTTIVAADAGASTWTVTATADTTNGGLAITVTGQASTTIRWVAKAETAEMTF